VEIILFGSAVRGELHPDSDLDVLVVIPSHMSEKQATVAIYRHLRGFPYPVDVIVVTTSHLRQFADRPGTIIHPALREGRRLYAAQP
jgi:predicted nucleotidyltransferase